MVFEGMVMVFEGSRETDCKKNINQPCIELVSQQNKLEPGPYSALFAYTNKTCARD